MNVTRDEHTGRPTCLNGMAAYVNHLNQKWWHDPATGNAIVRNKGQMRMLMISEVAEAMEGERKNLQDDKLPHRRMAEVELADVVIRLFDYAGGFDYELKDRWSERLEYDKGELVPAPLSKWDKFTKDSDRGEMLERLCINIVRVGQPGTITTSGALLSVLLFNCEYYCWLLGYDLWGAVFEKLEYNTIREDHKAEARLRAGGKAW